MDIVADLMQNLYNLRAQRLPVLQDNLDLNNPQALNILIADAMNALENLYIFLNMPEDGFVPNTKPKD